MLSVVIPSRDRADVLERALAALEHERPDEVVVVDDGSLDGTPDLLAANDWVRSVRLNGEGPEQKLLRDAPLTALIDDGAETGESVGIVGIDLQEALILFLGALEISDGE